MNESSVGFSGAIVILNSPKNAKRKVAGLSVFTRLLAQLKQAGASSVVVLAKDANEAEALARQAETEVPNLGVHIRIKQQSELTRISSLRMPNGKCVILLASSVFHPELITHLVNLDVSNGNRVVVRSTRTNDAVAAVVSTEELKRARDVKDLFAPNGENVFNPADWGWFAFKVKDDQAAKEAEAALIRTVIKPLDVDGIVCYLLTRRISTAITRRLLRTFDRIQPWHITAIAFLLGLAGGALAAVGGYWAMLAGAFLYQLSTICDNIDGEIARLKHAGSYLGQWLDTLSDDTTNIFFIMGMSVGLSRSSKFPFTWEYYWVLGLVVVIMLETYNYFIYRYLLRYTNSGDVFLYQWFFDAEDSDTAPQPLKKERKGFSKLMYYLKLLGRRDFFIFFFLMLALFNVLFLGLWAALIASSFTFVLVLIQEIKYNTHLRRPPD